MLATAYSFDTSAFANSWRRYYPPDLFSPIWAQLEALIDKGTILASEEVREELEQKDDELLQALKRNAKLFIPLDDEQQDRVIEVMQRFPDWVRPDSTKNSADPFVVALAMAKDLTVVTYEANGGPSQVSIPFACRQLGVPCFNFVDFMRDAGIRMD